MGVYYNHAREIQGGNKMSVQVRNHNTGETFNIWILWTFTTILKGEHLDF